MCCYSCWHSTAPEEVHGGEQKWGTLCFWKTGRTGLQKDILQSWFYEPNSYISSYLEKHQNPSWWWPFLVTSRSFTRLVETFWKNMRLIVCSLPFTKITYTMSFPPSSLEQSLRAIWGAVFWAAVLILPQVKLKSQLSCCTLFLVDSCGNLWSNPEWTSFLHLNSTS